MRFMFARRVRLFITTALLLTSLLGVVATPGAALAGLSGCRSDPVVTLTNGTVINMQSAIDTRLSNVQNVQYIVHAPAGTRVLLIVNTDGLIGLRERVTFYADQPAHEYIITTIVTTQSTGVNVSTSSLVIELLGLDADSARGRDRQRLDMHLYP